MLERNKMSKNRCKTQQGLEVLLIYHMKTLSNGMTLLKINLLRMTNTSVKTTDSSTSNITTNTTTVEITSGNQTKANTTNNTIRTITQMISTITINMTSSINSNDTNAIKPTSASNVRPFKIKCISTISMTLLRKSYWAISTLKDSLGLINLCKTQFTIGRDQGL